MTRREIARIGAATALVAVPTLLVTSGHGRDASAQSTDGTATAEESTIYRPATPVGSPQPEPTGPAEETLWTRSWRGQPGARGSHRLVHGSLAGAGRRRQTRSSAGEPAPGVDCARPRTAERRSTSCWRSGPVEQRQRPSPPRSPRFPRDARELVEQILRFWYLGIWDDQPVTDRAASWFGLSAWQAVEYTYAPAFAGRLASGRNLLQRSRSTWKRVSRSVSWRGL